MSVTATPSRADIVAFLIEKLVERVGIEAHDIDRDADLVGWGVKSIDAVLVSGELEDHYGVEIDPTLLFECRTVNRVADSIAETLSRR